MEIIIAKDLQNWDLEDQHQWASYGKGVANRNLWISIPSLLCGFSVWLYWGIITVQMLNLGFPFSQPELFTLTAIAGLSGATLRIPSAFLIRLAGGRNTIFLTTTLLILPAAGTGLALQDANTPLWQFQLLALLSGFGGGNFASSMSNMSFFFPKRNQGYGLGLNAGLGNFGVTTIQILVSLAMTFGLFGGEALILQYTSGTLIGKIEAGSQTWIYNGAYIWLCFLIPLALFIWMAMNNIVDDHVSPKIGGTARAFLKILVMLAFGLTIAAVGLYLMTPAHANGLGLGLNKWLVLPVVIAVTVLSLKLLLPGTGCRGGLTRQYRIFTNKHTWGLTTIYTMIIGSFIGYFAALALSIKVVFGFQHIMVNGIRPHTTANPNGLSALMFAWIGSFIGALIRPIGGKIADKMGGASVTQFVSFIMAGCALGVAYYMKQTYSLPPPEVYFYPFLGLFLIFFATSGIGNGSTFRSIATYLIKAGSGLGIGGRRLWRFYYPPSIRRTDQSGHSRTSFIWICCFLRLMHRH